MLRKLWWGQYSLAQTFWGFYVLGFLAVILICGLALLASYQMRMGTVGFIIAFIVFWTYLLITSIAVWRSASAHLASPIWMTKIYGIAARGIVLLYLGRAFWFLANGGALFLMARMTGRLDF